MDIEICILDIFKTICIQDEAEVMEGVGKPGSKIEFHSIFDAWSDIRKYATNITYDMFKFLVSQRILSIIENEDDTFPECIKDGYAYKSVIMDVIFRLVVDLHYSNSGYVCKEAYTISSAFSMSNVPDTYKIVDMCVHVCNMVGPEYGRYAGGIILVVEDDTIAPYTMSVEFDTTLDIETLAEHIDREFSAILDIRIRKVIEDIKDDCQKW